MTGIKSIYIGEQPITPLGNVWVGVSEAGLVAVEFQIDQHTFTLRLKKHLSKLPVQISLNEKKCNLALQQITDYLNGKRMNFDLPVDWSVMTPFQVKVLRLTYAIPYGATATYGEIASRTGKPGGARAVGRVQATNPMPVVIPCHRVIGSDGKLHGYGAANGLETKAWLLHLESTHLPK